MKEILAGNHLPCWKVKVNLETHIESVIGEAITSTDLPPLVTLLGGLPSLGGLFKEIDINTHG